MRVFENRTRADQSTRLELTMMKCLVNTPEAAAPVPHLMAIY